MATNRSVIFEALSDFGDDGFNWNGCGGLPIRDDVRETINLIYGSRKFLSKTIARNCPIPSVTLCDNGTIEIAYTDRYNDRQLFLTFQCKWTITYIQVFEDEQTTIEGTIRFTVDANGEFDADEWAVLVDLYDWLTEEC